MPRKSKGKFHVGIDIERVDRFGKRDSSQRFFSRNFTRKEIAYCMSKATPSHHFAGTFAAKEAVLKAVDGLTARRLGASSFEISHRENGVPIVTYSGSQPEIEGIEIRVSISHTAEYAVAVAIAMSR
jgi:phosphopantetheine--protein transferase-like protein